MPDNAVRFGTNLVNGPHGLLTSPGHQDTEFAYHDETDWPAIEDGSFWYQHRNRCFLGLIEHFHPHGAFWEIGAGNGNVSLALQATGREVIAVEPTVRSALVARQRGVRHVVCARVQEAGIAPGTLPNLGLFDVLEHIENDHAFVGELRELIAPGGLIFCAVPAWSVLWSREDDAAGHQRRYRRATLHALFTKAGFRIEYSGYFFAPLVLPILLLRTLPSALGLRVARTDRQSKKEHALPGGLAGRFLLWQLKHESSRIARGERIRLGASCLLVARAC